MRIVFVGPAGVGKTSLVRVINGQKVDAESESTIGICAMTLVTEDGVTVELWDTAGQERYAPMVELYTRDADVVIAAHDHVHDNNHRQMKSMLERLDAASNHNQTQTFALWQTKKDLCAPPNPRFTSAFVVHHTAFVSALEEPDDVRKMFNEVVQLHLRRNPLLTSPEKTLLLKKEEKSYCCY